MNPKDLIPTTDSLYRFMALAGISIILAVGWFFTTRNHEIQLMMIDLPEKSCLEAYEISALPEGSKERNLAHLAAQCRAKNNDARIIFLAKELDQIRTASVFALLFALVLVEEGFRRWYRIQLLQDGLLEKQATDETPPDPD